jgi:hypothetical protein
MGEPSIVVTVVAIARRCKRGRDVGGTKILARVTVSDED